MESNKNKTGLKMIALILIFIILYSIYVVGSYIWNSYKNEQLYNELQELKKEELKVLENSNIEKHVISKLEPFIVINSDVVGWVKINDTKIDYPVLKTDNNDYYLYHNIKNEQTRAGSIFMDFRNEGKGLDRNTIIYGHHMKDKSMFSGLVAYKQKSYYEEHPFIEFDTLYKEIQWEIFSAYITPIDFDYIQTDFSNDKEFEMFLKDIQSRSLYDTTAHLSKNDKILTLSTCTYEFENARFTIHAKMVESN
ncbi:class B sortase [Alkalibaculum sporogenes]|nr:class B sortase [Alkalibaculum sporogenes]